MATLVRVKTKDAESSTIDLTSSVPAPFSREWLQQEDPVRETPSQNDRQRVTSQQAPLLTLDTSDDAAKDTVLPGGFELMPSIASLERSCLMTLNNLLSVPTRWNPIVPDRRHSMPSSPTTRTEVESAESGPALQTLVSNLRNRDSSDGMIETHHAETESELIHELRVRVEGISTSLEPDDARLAQTLVSLLSHFSRLSEIQSLPSTSHRRSLLPQPWVPLPQHESEDHLHNLKRQLSDFQIERSSSQGDIIPAGSPPVLAVEAALLWTRIDDELEGIASICKERTESLPRFSGEFLPPQYDPADYEHHAPPEYDQQHHGQRSSLDDPKSRPAVSPTIAGSHMNEKMRLDLEAVTMAIDRLYLVAPQLHNQRVELKSKKVEQMEKARMQGMHASSSSRSGKQKEPDVKELEDILELLGKASERSMKDQSVVLEGGLKGRMERARMRDVAKRQAFVEQLIEHSDSGRFHGQDAILQPRIKNPEALLTLPEFMREAVPRESLRQDPQAMLTLPEFVKEPPPAQPQAPEPPAMSRIKSKGKNRDRSMSAPPMSWLRPSSRSGRATPDSKLKASESYTSKSSESTPKIGFEVHYVAENHENLQHMLVFLTVTGATPGVDVEAEVVPSFKDRPADGGDHLLVKSGPHTSLPLVLPGRTSPGKTDVKVQGGHYEIKLTSLPLSSASNALSSTDPVPLLDASQLSSANPTSFICASCSLPLVQSAKINRYKDLPSEHWEELVDAWMCHSDQKLHDQVAKFGSGRGFWPEAGQALVGGSYILFEQSSMTKNNICPAEETKRGEDWRLVRCLCGAVVGRCQEHRSGDTTAVVYRLLKYAIRPVSPTSEPTKIPLSAFIVEDMTEFVRAHATYRFVVQDEEDERARILIWLFKPSIQLSYSKSIQYSIPKSASINAAKVLFKLLGPSERASDLKSILNKYPGFPQAEYLFYPMAICRQLAGLLRESNSTYPESMRTMTGLDVGWLHRA